MKLAIIRVSVASLLDAKAQCEMAKPPFVRQWTASTGGYCQVVGVRNSVVYYHRQNGLGAVNLSDGRPLWTVAMKNIRHAVLFKGSLYAVDSDDKSGRLVRLDCAAGAVRAQVAMRPAPERVAVAGDRVYVLKGDGHMRAFDAGTLQGRWSAQIGPRRQRGVTLAHLATANGVVCAGLDGAGQFGVDGSTGRILWHEADEYGGLYRPLIRGNRLITHSGRYRCKDIRTGTVLWSGGKEESDPSIVGNVVVSCDQRELIGRSVETGVVLWRLPVRDKGTSYGGADEPDDVTDGETVLIPREPVVCVNKRGREIWHDSRPFTGHAVYADSRWVVAADSQRVFGYRAGQLPSLPVPAAEREALAVRLAKEFEILDDRERDQLDKLAPYSFRPLLARYEEWAHEKTSTTERMLDS